MDDAAARVLLLASVLMESDSLITAQTKLGYASVMAAPPLRKVASLKRGRGRQRLPPAAPSARVYAVAIARSLDTASLIDQLTADSRWVRAGWQSTSYVGGIVKVTAASTTGCCYFFPFGVAVSWALPPSEEAFVLEHARAVSDTPYALDALGRPWEEDDMAFSARDGTSYFGDQTASDAEQSEPMQSRQRSRSISSANQTRITNDEIVLGTSLASEEALAVSFAFAQSIKLSCHENSVEKSSNDMRVYPQRLATIGKVGLTEREISMKIGSLFVLRNSVNLYGDFLDTPEFLWEDDVFEPSFARARRYLDLDKRISVLNSRLDVLNQLLDILSQQATNMHANRLELIITVLILFEVFLMILFFLLRDVFSVVPLPRGALLP